MMNLFSLSFYSDFENVKVSEMEVTTKPYNLLIFQDVLTMILRFGMLNVCSNVPLVSVYLFHTLVIIH